MVHHLFVGEFEHEGGYVRFTPIHPLAFEASKPVVRRRMDADTIAKIWIDINGNCKGGLYAEERSPQLTPEGFLLFDRHALTRKDIKFISQLVECSNCEIYDVSIGKNLLPEELEIRRS
jgi:hypothetical protein